MHRLVRKIPGFRSENGARKLIALSTYLFAALASVGGLWTIGVAVVVAGILIANPSNLRGRIPLFGSGRIGTAMLSLLLGGLASVAILAQAASLPSATSTPKDAAGEAHVLAAAALPTSTVAPQPSL